ncbi:MAG: hypothetical protein K8R91_02305 [Phycisphaerae bacterium]|nr:hypothetical protein [Phycisphaerae bacterium]
MKIRCQQCHKKIVTDEGFAGGLCRCPYCRAITMVSGGRAINRAARPDSPNEVAASQTRQVKSDEAVPLAKPVVIQGIARMVLVGFVLFLLVVVILIAMYVLFNH